MPECGQTPTQYRTRTRASTPHTNTHPLPRASLPSSSSSESHPAAAPPPLDLEGVSERGGDTRTAGGNAAGLLDTLESGVVATPPAAPRALGTLLRPAIVLGGEEVGGCGLGARSLPSHHSPLATCDGESQ